MIFHRFHEPKLAQYSYLLGCPASKEAVVIDPYRQVDRYLKAANDEGLKIRHVTETHIHADFVSGARELAHQTGARLYLSGSGGDDWSYRYAADAGATLLRDGSCFRVGAIELRVWHVAGHTPEHLLFLVTDTEAASEPMGALTGDFLFVGDVGRPDLLERAVRTRGTMVEGARQLYRSLQRFQELPEYIQIWPGHGAGSACGKSLGAVPQSTLGYEKRFNWAFGLEDEAKFVEEVLAGQPDPPRYFAEMKWINRSGPRLLGEVHRPSRQTLSTLVSALQQGAMVVDTREAPAYAAAAVPGTINIPRNRAFTTWAGSLVPYDRDFYLIVDGPRVETVDELVRDLRGIGLDRVAGYFGSEVVEEWSASQGRLQVTPTLELEDTRKRSSTTVVLDVRGQGEWRAGHLPGSLNLPLGELDQRLDEIPPNRPLVVHCQTGSRAAMAASLLRARGFDDVRLFSGGFVEWQSAGLPVESEG